MTAHTEAFIVSNDVNGGDGDARSVNGMTSANGRHVAFVSDAADLALFDDNGFPDIFVENVVTGETSRLEMPAFDADLRVTGISADGNEVLFETGQSFSADDTNGRRDAYLWDVNGGTVTLVSRDKNGDATGILSSGKESSLSASGNVATFRDFATGDIKLFFTATGKVSTPIDGLGGAVPNGTFSDPSLSAGGQFLVFASTASNLVGGDLNGKQDIFVFDRTTGLVTLVSLASDGSQGNGASATPQISADGSRIIYTSFASDLVTGDSNGQQDVFVTEVDYGAGTFNTIRVSLDQNGDQIDSLNQSRFPTISADGEVIGYEADADNDFHTEAVFKRYPIAPETANVLLAVIEGNGSSGTPHLSGSGNVGVFNSSSDNLGVPDGNLTGDVYGVRSLLGTNGNDDITLFNVALFGTLEGEVLNAGLGNDTVTGTRANEIVDLGDGDDTGFGRGGGDLLAGGGGSDQIFGGRGGDIVFGDEGNDTLIGGAGDDSLEGGDGTDRLVAGGGNDTLIGGLGRDVLVAGSGADTLTWNDFLESGLGSLRDLVRNFAVGEDMLDLSGIDANILTAGDDPFNPIGDGEFSGSAGEIRAFTTASQTVVEGDVDGDAGADFQIALDALFANFLQASVEF